LKNVKIYLYEGISRENATQSVIHENKKAVENGMYAVEIDSGILIIAIPDEDK
jgi:molybdenum cofactor biosynthesis enzyme MoaA